MVFKTVSHSHRWLITFALNYTNLSYCTSHLSNIHQLYSDRAGDRTLHHHKRVRANILIREYWMIWLQPILSPRRDDLIAILRGIFENWRHLFLGSIPEGTQGAHQTSRVTEKPDSLVLSEGTVYLVSLIALGNTMLTDSHTQPTLLIQPHPQIASPTRLLWNSKVCVQNLDKTRHQDFASSRTRGATKKRKKEWRSHLKPSNVLLSLTDGFWVWP